MLVGSALLAAVLSGCGADRAAPPAEPRPEGLVVASFDFAESRLLAEIYAQALEHAGVAVRREADLGPRELVLPALQQGLVDLVPEYLGSAVVALDPDAPVEGAAAPELRDRLADALAPWDVAVLEAAPAANQNVYVVTERFARSHDITTVSALSGLAPSLRVAGPPECPRRRHCLRGLEEVYGLRFAGFVPVQGPAQARRALEEDLVQVGVLFATDGPLAAAGLVVLDDDAGLNPAENVVPVLRREARRRHGEVVVRTLDEISSRLTTEALRFLNWRLTVDGAEVDDEARGWLLRHDLIPR